MTRVGGEELLLFLLPWSRTLSVIGAGVLRKRERERERDRKPYRHHQEDCRRICWRGWIGGTYQCGGYKCLQVCRCSASWLKVQSRVDVCPKTAAPTFEMTVPRFLLAVNVTCYWSMPGKAPAGTPTATSTVTYFSWGKPWSTDV